MHKRTKNFCQHHHHAAVVVVVNGELAIVNCLLNEFWMTWMVVVWMVEGDLGPPNKKKRGARAVVQTREAIVGRARAYMHCACLDEKWARSIWRLQWKVTGQSI